MNRFRTAIATTTLLVGLVGVAQTPAMAQDGERYRDRYDRSDRDDDRRDRDYNRDHDRDWRRDRREGRRYDYDRVEPGQRRYDAARYYYWDQQSYRARRLDRYDRVYRGYDDRYYCRRSDGTTGLIVGGITGGVLGGILTPGDSKTLGTILGAAGGAIVGHSIDRSNIVCR